MSGAERRKRILEILSQRTTPVSATVLAEQTRVSRQVIVQDVALLRSSGHNIISTYRGYLIMQQTQPASRVLKVQHTDEQIADEMNTIVDLGGVITDVFVSHRIYGLVRVEMNIRCRLDVIQYMEQLASGQSSPLMHITSNYHYHTIQAADPQALQRIYDALQEKGYLVAIDDWDWQYVACNS